MSGNKPFNQIYNKTMGKVKRDAPYTRKGFRGEKKHDKKIDFFELEMQQAGIDTENLKNRMSLMTAEQFANTQQVAAQNALRLFNDMLEEVRHRLPQMKDEVIVTTLLSIWDKTDGGK
jgi:hypothetical protein